MATNTDMDSASHKFDILIEVDPKPLFYLKLGLAAAAFLTTFGLVEVYPKAYVRVIERQSGRVVMEHVCRTPSSAQSDLDSITMALQSSSLQDFCSRYGIDLMSDAE